VRRELSRGRWPARVEAAAVTTTTSRPPAFNGGRPRIADELARWSGEARQLMHVLGGWLEDAGRLQADVGALERERGTLTGEVRRLERENEELRAERDDLSRAIQTIAGQTARTVDELLSRIGGRQGVPGEPAER
jgi:septal ring factor EnvC (AmiA/AmiB activator)